MYGEPGAARIAEEVSPAPTSPYGSSKLAADRAVADLAATGAIGAVSLRAFNVAGGLPGHADRDETRLVPKAVAVVQGRAPELVVNGDGGAVRDHVHVADMADAFARALDACRPGHWTAYNVGSGRRSTIMDVVASRPRRWRAGPFRSATTGLPLNRRTPGRCEPHPPRPRVAAGDLGPAANRADAYAAAE